MEVRVKDSHLLRVLMDASEKDSMPDGIAKALKRRYLDLLSAEGESDLAALKSFEFKQLLGDRSHQRSIRLVEKWIVVLEPFEESGSKYMKIIGIEKSP